MKKKLTTIFFAIFSIFLISSFILFFKVYTQYKKNEEIYKTKLENPPLVSVIMPFYNRKEYINKAIDSVLNQSYDNLEIILVDDHSTDGTYEILQEYAEKDKRIKLFRNEKNMHVSFTRNVGIKNSTGKYLYFIDSDDWIDRRFIEEMVLYAEKYDLDMVYNPNIYNAKNEKKINIITKYLIKKNTYTTKKSGKALASVCVKLFRKSTLEKNNLFFPVNLKNGEDGFFVSSFFDFSNNTKTIKSNNIYYGRVKHRNSITQNTNSLDIFKDLLKINKMREDKKTIHIVKIIAVNTDISEELYQLSRNYLFEIKNDIIEKKHLYNSTEIFLFNLILKNNTYESFKKNLFFNELFFNIYAILSLLFFIIGPYLVIKKILIPIFNDIVCKRKNK